MLLESSTGADEDEAEGEEEDEGEAGDVDDGGGEGEGDAVDESEGADEGEVGLGVGGIQHFSPLQPHQHNYAPLQQRAQLPWLCLPSNLTSIFLPPLQHDQP